MDRSTQFGDDDDWLAEATISTSSEVNPVAAPAPAHQRRLGVVPVGTV
jgi:hypothetical protein